MTSLKTILRLNAAACVFFGVVFLAFPGPVAGFLGTAPAPLILGLGLALMVNGAHLWLAAQRARPLWAEVLWFSLGDLAWWLATAGLIATGRWITSAPGIAAALAVGLGVAALGCAQLLLIGASAAGQTPREHLGRVLRSWLALPRWVKLWLVALNLVFLAAPLILPWPAAGAVLTAYLASGPLLIAFAFSSGGMTRIMGLGHLVPWTPLLVWLLCWSAGASGPASIYALVLAGATALCLALDLYDLARWARGARGVIGAA